MPGNGTRRARVSSPSGALGEHPGGVVVTVWAVPGASRTEIKGLHGDAVKVRVSAPAEEGRANGEICRLLHELTGRPAELISGARSRRKRILLRGADLETVAAALPPEG